MVKHKRAAFAYWRFTTFGTLPETCAAQWNKHQRVYNALVSAWWPLYRAYAMTRRAAVVMTDAAKFILMVKR